MILLKNSTDILQIYSSAAVPVEISVNYIDLNQQTRIQEPGRLSVVITSTGITNILRGRGEYGIYRAIKQLSIFNGDDTNSTSIELRHSGLHENETSPRVVTQYATLLAKGQTVQYTTGQGFYKQGQYDVGTDETLLHDGSGDTGRYLKFLDVNTVQGVTKQTLKEELDIGELFVNESGDLFVNGGLYLQPDTPAGEALIDLGGGTIVNGNIDAGTVNTP